MNTILSSPIYIAQSKLENFTDTGRKPDIKTYWRSLLCRVLRAKKKHGFALDSYNSHKKIRNRMLNVLVVPNEPIMETSDGLTTVFLCLR